MKEKNAKRRNAISYQYQLLFKHVVMCSKEYKDGDEHDKIIIKEWEQVKVKAEIKLTNMMKKGIWLNLKEVDHHSLEQLQVYLIQIEKALIEMKITTKWENKLTIVVSQWEFNTSLWED